MSLYIICRRCRNSFDEVEGDMLKKNDALARLGLDTSQRPKVLVSITDDDVLRPKPSTVVETEKPIFR